MRKIITILLACMVLLGTVTAVSAAETLTDNFNSEEAGTKGIYTSDVWEITDDTTKAFAGTAEGYVSSRLTMAIEAEGNNKYLSITQAGVNVGVATVIQEYGDNTLVMNFKVRIPSAMASATGDWRMGVDTNSDTPAYLVQFVNNGFRKPGSTGAAQGSGTAAVYDYDTWYSVLVKSTPASASVWIFDDSDVLVYSHTITPKTNVSFEKAQIGFRAKGSGNSAVLHLDDCELALYSAEEAAQPFTSSTMEEGATDVTRLPSVAVELNPLVFASQNLSCVVTDEHGATLESGVDYTFTQTGLFAAAVTFNNLLDRNTDYTMDFYTNGESAGTITFTTENAHLVVADALTLENEGGNMNALAAGDVTVSLSVIDPLDYPTLDAKLMLVLYTEEGYLEWLDFASATFDAGTFTADFTLPTIPENASLEVLLLDGVQNFMPICTPVGF